MKADVTAGANPPTRFKVGDKVLITRAARDGENGWDNVWVLAMNAAVGKIGTITDLNENSPVDIGISVSVAGVDHWHEGYNYNYPAYVLQKVEPTPLSPAGSINSVFANDGKVISVSRKEDTVKIVTKRPSGRVDTVTLGIAEARELSEILSSL